MNEGEIQNEYPESGPDGIGKTGNRHVVSPKLPRGTVSKVEATRRA